MKYSPEYFETFKQKYPIVAQDFDKLAQDCVHAGPLDMKLRRITKLGAAIGIGSHGDIQNHVMQALNEGFSPYEIRHAVVLTLTTVGFPRMIEAMVCAEEIISKHI